MIAFITTIRHPQNSHDYGRVGRLLSHTLESIVAQTDPNFVVIVVHNQRPDVTVTDDRITYVRVDFPPPSYEQQAILRTPARFRDRGTKYAVGLAAALGLGVDHVMFFDADDLLSRRLAHVANSDATHPGWFFTSGYIHSVGTRTVQLVPTDFHRKNGSTSIVRADLIGLPETITVESTQQQILDEAGEPFIDHVIGKHGYWDEHLAPGGHTMEALPFPGAIWMIGTGENVSGNIISGRDRQPITPDITAEFALERPGLRWAVAASIGLKLAQVRRKVGR